METFTLSMTALCLHLEIQCAIFPRTQFAHRNRMAVADGSTRAALKEPNENEESWYACSFLCFGWKR